MIIIDVFFFLNINIWIYTYLRILQDIKILVTYLEGTFKIIKLIILYGIWEIVIEVTA